MPPELTDYGKVVEGLKCCVRAEETGMCPDDCPIVDMCETGRNECHTMLMQAAHDLIQEQALALYELRKKLEKFKITEKEVHVNDGT